MQIKRIAILLAFMLALGASGLAFAAFSAAPAPADILNRAVTTLENAQDGHAVLQIQGTSPDKSGSATIEVWAKKLADGSGRYKFRAEVRDSSDAKLKGAVAVSDGKTFWVYEPAQNTVRTGPVDQMNQSQAKSPQDLVQQLLDYSTATLAGSESVNGHATYKLQLVPNSKAPQAAAGATGLVWIDQSSWVSWKASVNAGSMGQGQVTAQVLGLNVSMPDSLFQFQAPAGAKVVQVQDLKLQHLTLSEAKTSAGFPVLTPSYVPAGATLVDVLKAGNTIVLRYESSHGSFSIEQSATAKGNVPSAVGESVLVRGTTGTLLTNPAGSEVMLIWTESGRRFRVSGALSRQAALKVAESLQ
jgi:outer membrane lipoprotein-sorting protein